jgi:hypothetical protein
MACVSPLVLKGQTSCLNIGCQAEGLPCWHCWTLSPEIHHSRLWSKTDRVRGGPQSFGLPAVPPLQIAAARRRRDMRDAVSNPVREKDNRLAVIDALAGAAS